MNQWARRVKDRKARSDWEQFAEQVYKDNKREVERNIDLEIREWKQDQFFNSGLFLGQLEKIFLDAQESGLELVDLQKDQAAPQFFIEGWYTNLEQHGK